MICTTKTAEFIVLGRPVGKGRPQFSTYGGHVHARTPQKTAVYENLVRLEYQRQCGGMRFEDDAALKVSIKAYYDIPASKSKKMKEAMAHGTIRPTKKPDCDNVIKSVLDALSSVAYHDDVQVVDVTLCKWYSYEPRIEVVITDITDAETEAATNEEPD